MTEPILVIMAAGMGSRYGGLKQIDPVGPSGELIIDYSLFDARRAGFKRVVFLIKPEIEADFKAVVGTRMEDYFEVSYAFQTLDMLPTGYSVPAGRQRPWGTGHAVLCCGDLIDAPFCVINADDYYGVSAFKEIYNALRTLQDDAAIKQYVMVGYLLENTLTDHGHVARGVCVTDENHHLKEIHERTHIIKTCEGALYTLDQQIYHKIPESSPVSMNLWGFTPSILETLESEFPHFLDETIANDPMEGEYFLPSVVDGMIQKGLAQVKVLASPDKWYGVTYKQDKPVVAAAMKAMTDSGVYPQRLWD